MATRSTISIQNLDGTFRQIYCHWDGYLENNGRILKTHYRTPEKVKQLLDLGNLSVLEENIEPSTDTHSFESPEENVCVFYGRDRGDDSVSANRYENKEMFLLTCNREEYDYIYVEEEQKWYLMVGNKSRTQYREFLQSIDEQFATVVPEEPTDLTSYIEYYKHKADHYEKQGLISDAALIREMIKPLLSVL